MKKKFFVISFLLQLWFLVQCSQQIVASRLHLSDLHFATTPNGMQQIEGNGINTTNQTLKHVFVKFNLLQNNTVVGQTIAMVESLRPDRAGKYRLLIIVFLLSLIVLRLPRLTL